MQCLASCPRLIEHLLRNHLGPALPPALGAAVLSLLGLLLALNRNSPVSASFLEDFLAQGLGGAMDLSQQQDAHEFLQIVSEKISAVAAFHAAQAQSLGAPAGFSPPRLPFDSTALVSFECLNCGKAGNFYRKSLCELSLSLADFAQQRAVALSALLERFLRGEKVVGSHCPQCTLDRFREGLPPRLGSLFSAFSEELTAFECGDCDALLERLRAFAAQSGLEQRVEAAKTTRVQRVEVVDPADILVLHVNRVITAGSSRPFKLNAKVDLPLRLEFAEKSYALRAFVAHVGRADLGHYVSVSQRWSALKDIDDFENGDHRERYEYLDWLLISDESELIRRPQSHSGGSPGNGVGTLCDILRTLLIN